MMSPVACVSKYPTGSVVSFSKSCRRIVYTIFWLKRIINTARK